MMKLAFILSVIGFAPSLSIYDWESARHEGMEARRHEVNRVPQARSHKPQATTLPPQLEVEEDPYLPNAGGPDGGPRGTVQAGPYVSVQVNTNAQGQNTVNDAANETSITISPFDPNRLLIGWRQFDNIASNFRQAGRGYSTDGGVTWTNPGPLQPGVFRSDPVLDTDADGRFFYNSLCGSGCMPSYRVQMFISPDAINNWIGPIEATGGDKQWFTFDKTNGPGRNHLYMSWSTAAGCCGSNIFTRSTDGGLTYMTPIALPTTPIWGTLTVAPNGTLLISGTSAGINRVLRSTNAQNAAVTPTFTSVNVNLGGTVSTGGAPNPGGLTGQLWIASDHSGGPTNGNLYLLASVNPAGTDPMDVMFSRSVDGGATWNAPLKINSDPATANAWQWFGAMSVAPNGRIDAIWYDTRASQSGVISELYYAYSYNAGVPGSWSTNIRLSPQFNSTIGWPNQNKIGDYIGCLSDNATVMIAYSGTFNGEQNVYFLRAGDCNNNGVHDGLDIANGFSFDSNANAIPDECEGIIACVADITGDDVVNVNDLLAVINAWGQCSECPPFCQGDVNHDCTVNVNDLLAVINAWGPCP